MREYASHFGRGGLNDQVDSGRLLSDIGLDRREIQWRKDFVGFDGEDVERLSRFEDLFEEHAEQVSEMFYENLTQYDQTTEVMGRSSKSVEQLKRTQQAYLVSLASGEYGMDYFRNRARIGKLHDILDMPMKHYIGQYGVYYDLLSPIITERIQEEVSAAIDEATQDLAADGGVGAVEGGAAEPDTADSPEGTTDAPPAPSIDTEAIEARAHEAVAEGIREFHSILKIINLDMQVVADTYIESYTQEIESTLDQQQEVATEVSAAVGELTDASDNVATSATEISVLAEDQSESMDEVAGEVSNLSATVEEVASSADTVAERSQEAREMATSGLERGERVLEVMADVDQASEQVQDDVTGLQETVEEIDDIIEVINDIASQTNLLALNANIEAARAGEAGQGFAVVADEIKALAEQSQEQAGEIEDMLEDIRGNTNETVESLETTQDRIDRGGTEVEETIEMLEEIAEAVGETVAGIQEVSDATDQQAASAEEIAAMVDQARDKARDVAAEIEDVAASTEEQAAKVQEIDSSMERLSK